MEPLNGFSIHDSERVKELKKLGYQVFTADPLELCYWRARGGRISPLFVTTEAAWRDALRVHEAAVDEVKPEPQASRASQVIRDNLGSNAMPVEESAELNHLKRCLKVVGYTFPNRRRDNVFVYDGCTVGGYESHAACIRGAVKHWARRDPEGFCRSMNLFGKGAEPSSIYDQKPFSTVTAGPLTPLTSEELAKLQGMPGFDELPEDHQELTVRSQQLLKHLAQRGIKIDMSAISRFYPCEAASVSYKSQGKTFAEVAKDLGAGIDLSPRMEPDDKAVRGVLTPGQYGMYKTLECAGYTFYVTPAQNWFCSSINAANCDLLTVLQAAWQHALENGGNAEDMASTAQAYSMSPEQVENMGAELIKAGGEMIMPQWSGIGLPPQPVGTICWVMPHNTIWGFNSTDPSLCKILAYHHDYVWLEQLSDKGESLMCLKELRVGIVGPRFITSRPDKLDFKVWKGNDDA
jgi:hypothetical protein